MWRYAWSLSSSLIWSRSEWSNITCFISLQIEKIVLFLLEQQGILASRLENLGKERALLAEQPDISKISELREAYRAVGHDLLKLLKFVDMNATGIRKILKKFDKRFGYKFTDYYVSTRSNHPYSQLQQVFKHVVNSKFQLRNSQIEVSDALETNKPLSHDSDSASPLIYIYIYICFFPLLFCMRLWQMGIPLNYITCY